MTCSFRLIRPNWTRIGHYFADLRKHFKFNRRNLENGTKLHVLKWLIKLISPWALSDLVSMSNGPNQSLWPTIFRQQAITKIKWYGELVRGVTKGMNKITICYKGFFTTSHPVINWFISQSGTDNHAHRNEKSLTIGFKTLPIQYHFTHKKEHF